jgi:membrane-associated phospholipid phosphatase
MMRMMAPPAPPPRVALDDPDGHRRLQTRIWQVTVAIITTLVTAWFCTLGPIPAILALMVAKHILVAILAWGLQVDEPPAAAGPS